MKKIIVGLILVAAVAGVAFYSGFFTRESTQAAGTAGGGQGGPSGGARGRGGRGFAGPMTVELATVARASVSQQLVVVGNLIGEATVAVVPKTAGRLEEVHVRLGDRVARGQRLAKIEDQEIREQVRQAQAAFEVASATIRQREADLKLAETSVDRSRSLFARQLLPKQTLDDNEARYQAAVAQLDLARAQHTQSQARLEELRITLANTVIVSPVDGFVARRAADPGAFVSQNAPVVDVVDIGRVRLVANVVEKDLKPIEAGDPATVEVDAYPGEQFTGRIARVSPVLDPATRTAPIEVEIPNPGYRLKPGMYARVGITTVSRNNALVVPTNAVVDVEGRRGVFLAENNKAAFRPVQVGIEEDTRTEILDGVNEGDRVITTGAAALSDGEDIMLAGARGRGGRGAGPGAFGAPGSAPAGSGPASLSRRTGSEADGGAGRPGATGASSADAAPQRGDTEGRGSGRRGGPSAQQPAGGSAQSATR